MGENGTVKVLDFGLAKVVESAATELTHCPKITALSDASVILGTAGYMSPEQARGQRVDTRTDIWAFGCVLYEMLAGTPAFAVFTRDHGDGVRPASIQRS